MQHILYRQKEQFSNGVGFSWIDGLKAHAAKHVLNPTFLVYKFSDGFFYCHKIYVYYNWFFTTPQTPRKHTTTE